MNKFQVILRQSSKEIKENRARIASENAKDASEELVRKLSKELRTLESQLDHLTDLNRDSELSLKVIKDDFNATNWMANIQNVKLAIVQKKIELEVAKETYADWFDELPVEGKKKSKDE